MKSLNLRRLPQKRNEKRGVNKRIKEVEASRIALGRWLLLVGHHSATILKSTGKLDALAERCTDRAAGHFIPNLLQTLLDLTGPALFRRLGDHEIRPGGSST